MSESTNKDPKYLAHARDICEKTIFNDPKEMVRAMRENPTLFGDLPGILQGNLARTVTGRAFAVTAAGRMALVPPLSRPGDLLCYIQCAVLPFVLRKGTEAGQTLMGTCYVHGCPDVYRGSGWLDCALV